jgi:hypothetical protein
MCTLSLSINSSPDDHLYTNDMTSSVPELRRQFGSIATLHPFTKGPVLTFTTFGSCLSDNVEVPCSTALGRLFDEGWKSWSEGRDEEMVGMLRMLSWLGVSYRIRQYILRLVWQRTDMIRQSRYCCSSPVVRSF